MSYSPALGSAFNDTKTRSQHLNSLSGMCSFCTAECPGTCEIGISAALGARSVYPTNTGNNQVASEKVYPVDYSHFNINGRVFGAQGAEPDMEKATIFNVDLSADYGTIHPVKQTMPIILPALIKLNWQDYFGGAAMAGVSCIIGEDAVNKDPGTVLDNGKIVEAPWLGVVLDSFRKYDRGYGQIVLQCNIEDDAKGVAEYAIRTFGANAIEFKFGQSAKGTQPVVVLPDYEAALKAKANGMVVHPDPEDPDIVAKHKDGCAPNFYTYSRLPMWTEEYLIPHIDSLRDMGMENVYFKMAGYDPEDLETVLRIASAARVDMVTFDGAGGGSGYSPCRMMNEWGLPTITMGALLVPICEKLIEEGFELPAIALTGGFSMEDQVFKALALGAPYITHIGLCRAAMAAATSAAKMGEMIQAGNVPAHIRPYGTTVQEIFKDLPDLRALYGRQANDFSPGAIGVYSYLNRIASGLRHFCALNRKFDWKLIDRSDVIPLTVDAYDILAMTEDAVF
ncbi:MAG TPA: FMN-binding glutamate synthase family protein [Clostridiales bacterium]|nr:FMN-binding glutamate synthase family protein [Clostridiales bacterium]